MDLDVLGVGRAVILEDLVDGTPYGSHDVCFVL